MFDLTYFRITDEGLNRRAGSYASWDRLPGVQKPALGLDYGLGMEQRAPMLYPNRAWLNVETWVP